VLTVCVLLPPAGLVAASLALGVAVHALLRRLPWLAGSGPFAHWVSALALALGAASALLLLLLVIPAVPDRWIRAEPRGDIEDADVFVVFGLGLGQLAGGRETPGESNRALARWLAEHNPGRKPAVVQEGVYLALRELEESRPGLRVGDWAIRLPHRPGVYVDTAGAALQSWAVMDLKGYRRPTLVAHDLQLQRMVWTFEPFGFEGMVVPDMPSIPFDARSSQHWGTRSRTGWLLWELLFARPLALRPRGSLLLAFLGGLLLVAVWRALGRMSLPSQGPLSLPRPLSTAVR
jgi:hypothetical protein